MHEMSTDQLIETIMIRPTVTLIPTDQHTGLTSAYSFEPLSNLIYMRDQQITTARGIVMGHLKTPQRRLETEVMKFAFTKLGARPSRPNICVVLGMLPATGRFGVEGSKALGCGAPHHSTLRRHALEIAQDCAFHLRAVHNHSAVQASASPAQ